MIINSIKFTLIALLLSFSLFADTITINSVTGSWSNITGETYLNVHGGGTNFIYWGATGAPASADSSYLFTGNAPPVYSVTPDVPFVLGTLDMVNNVIPNGSAITGATLNINIGLSINGSSFTTPISYNLLHDETVNNDPPCCGDTNTFLNNNPYTQTITVGGKNYAFQITGFEIGGVPVTEDTVQENSNSLLQLEAIIIAPEPSTYMILGSFLVIFGFVAKKRLMKRV